MCIPNPYKIKIQQPEMVYELGCMNQTCVVASSELVHENSSSKQSMSSLAKYPGIFPLLQLTDGTTLTAFEQ
jgi:hypothetical protein